MNLHKYWLKVKRLYPVATAECVAHFKQSHPREEWRTQFKDPEQIITYLERRKIHIITRKRRYGNNPTEFIENHKEKICFELRCWEETTVTAYRYTKRTTALYDAIERAFRILEQREMRKRARGERPFERMRKKKRLPTTNRNWGEEMRKKGGK